jgi:nicotinamide riboside transporter PnuC
MNTTKWLGTTICLVGIGLTSLNIYPANIFFGLVGSFLWACAGWKQEDYALFLVELVATLMYFFGTYLYIYNKLF